MRGFVRNVVYEIHNQLTNEIEPNRLSNITLLKLMILFKKMETGYLNDDIVAVALYKLFKKKLPSSKCEKIIEKAKADPNLSKELKKCERVLILETLGVLNFSLLESAGIFWENFVSKVDKNMITKNNLKSLEKLNAYNFLEALENKKKYLVKNKSFKQYKNLSFKVVDNLCLAECLNAYFFKKCSFSLLTEVLKQTFLQGKLCFSTLFIDMINLNPAATLSIQSVSEMIGSIIKETPDTIKTPKNVIYVLHEVGQYYPNIVYYFEPNVLYVTILYLIHTYKDKNLEYKMSKINFFSKPSSIYDLVSKELRYIIWNYHREFNEIFVDNVFRDEEIELKEIEK